MTEWILIQTNLSKPNQGFQLPSCHRHAVHTMPVVHEPDELMQGNWLQIMVLDSGMKLDCLPIATYSLIRKSTNILEKGRTDWRSHLPAFPQRDVEFFQHKASCFPNLWEAVLAGVGDILPKHDRRKRVDFSAWGHLWNTKWKCFIATVNQMRLPAAWPEESLHHTLQSLEISGCWSSGSADVPLQQRCPARCAGP